MTGLAGQRCHHHPGREAAARCPECRRFFCRECVTEHEDRVICSDCLARLARSGAGSVARRARWLWPLVQGAASLLLLWVLLYGLGRALLRLPSAFHEGTIWPAENERDAE